MIPVTHGEGSTMFRFVIAFLAAAFCAAESGFAIASERWSDAKVFIKRPGITAGGLGAR